MSLTVASVGGFCRLLVPHPPITPNRWGGAPCHQNDESHQSVLLHVSLQAAAGAVPDPVQLRPCSVFSIAYSCSHTSCCLRERRIIQCKGAAVPLVFMAVSYPTGGVE